MIEIDGSLGEGGGQVVRTSLTLAVMTGQPVHVTHVRARRAKPGLQPQHLAAVHAAAAISGAEVEGAAIDSAELTFRPNGIFPGKYRFDIRTAGATSLVIQTVYLPLALRATTEGGTAGPNIGRDRPQPPNEDSSGRSRPTFGPAVPESQLAEIRSSGRSPTVPESQLAEIRSSGRSPTVPESQFAERKPDSEQEENPSAQRPLRSHSSEIMVIGGTHVPHSPCFHYLALNWLPVLRQLGCDLDLEMLLAGFYPQGQGQVRATIRPVSRLAPLDLPERGALRAIRGISAVANLDMSIAERQQQHALRRLKERTGKVDIELLEMPARTKGTLLLLLAEFRHTTACYFGLGALGKRAEQVADEACLWLEKFLAGTGAVDEYLADQLLLPLAFADGESRFRTALVTDHLRTNAAVIEAFGAAEITLEKNGRHGEGSVRVRPQG